MAKPAQIPPAPPPDPVHYAEWDYQMQLDRPAWCTVLEKRAPSGEVAIIDEIVVKHKPVISRLKFLIESMQPQGVQRIRKQEDGDAIDLNAAIRAMIEIRLGEQPDPRIMMRNVRNVRDLSVLLLIAKQGGHGLIVPTHIPTAWAKTPAHPTWLGLLVS